MTGDVAYSDIGVLLSSARHRQKLRLEQVSQMLHIRVRYLDALEQGRLTELPGVTYAKGYLQSYAAFLGLDKDEILRRFEQVEAQLGKRNFYFPEVFSKRKTPSPAVIWGGLGTALAAYVAWMFVFQEKQPFISIVEPYKAAAQKMRLSADLAVEVACLRPQDVLYPPCTMRRQEQAFTLIPLQGQLKTVMELAQ